MLGIVLDRYSFPKPIPKISKSCQFAYVNAFTNLPVVCGIISQWDSPFGTSSSFLSHRPALASISFVGRFMLQPESKCGQASWYTAAHTIQYQRVLNQCLSDGK